MNDIELIIKAAEFAAEKHKFQRRKGFLRIPYVNHPLKVCKLLSDVGEHNLDLLVSAILHDVLEDTDATFEELNKLFGESISSIVFEVSDNMKLSEMERKELQISKAPFLSDNAKLIKISDKYCNISDLINYPINWSKERKINYINWSLKVYEGCKGRNNKLDEMFMSICKEAKNSINSL